MFEYLAPISKAPVPPCLKENGDARLELAEAAAEVAIGSSLAGDGPGGLDVIGPEMRISDLRCGRLNARVLGGEGHRTLHRGQLEADGGGVVGGKGLGVDEEGRFVDLRATAGLTASLLRFAVCAPGSQMQQPAAAVGLHGQAGDAAVVRCCRSPRRRGRS